MSLPLIELLNWLHSSTVGQQSSPGKHLQSLPLAGSSGHCELTEATRARPLSADLMTLRKGTMAIFQATQSLLLRIGATWRFRSMWHHVKGQVFSFI